MHCSTDPVLTGPVLKWFEAAFPDGPTNAQQLAWPAISSGQHTLLVSPTGTGKTLAAFLAILNDLYSHHLAGSLACGLRCVYVSPLRSLGYDVERSLTVPLDAVRMQLGLEASPIRIGVRTGDSSATHRRKLRDNPPHILITTPESLSLLLSQLAWTPHWSGLTHVIIDEVHSLAPTKRGVDLAISLERLAACANTDPIRIGLSATCKPPEVVAQFLVGPDRSCRILEASDARSVQPHLTVESLIRPDELPLRGLTYRRLLARLNQVVKANRTTIVFANTRAFTEKITHDLRAHSGDTIAAHHSALDRDRRRAVEASLKAGDLRAVVTSTSLELGVDIGTADISVLIGLPGTASRCLQRVGRAGHTPGEASRGVLLAATPAELMGSIVTAGAARDGRIEPMRVIQNPLDVLCQQLLGLACAGETSIEEAFALIRKAGPMSMLSREDFDACLEFLAGDLAAPSGAYEPEPGATPRWTSPRIWKAGGRFGIRSRRVIRQLWANVGTINSEESCRVVANGISIGTIESAYAERLQPGDRFVLDGRSLEFRRLEDLIVQVRASGAEPNLPRWSSDRQGLSAELARDLAMFRAEAANYLAEGPAALRSWLWKTHAIDLASAAVVESLIAAQERESEVPTLDMLLVEMFPADDFGSFTYAFHAPLGRSAIEALARASAARLGRRFGEDLGVAIADLGWSVTLPSCGKLTRDELQELISKADFVDDMLEGLDRGELLANRFRHVATTALMVLRNPEGKRMRVGGMMWVSRRLFPLVQAACPDHPLLRETRRVVIEDVIDTSAALAWIESNPTIRFRSLSSPSPFTLAWISPSDAEAVAFETADSALERLHARLLGPARSGCA